MTDDFSKIRKETDQEGRFGMRERWNELIKRLHRAKLVPALASIAFGIALIIARKSAMDVMVKITAGTMIAIGVGSVLMFLFSPVKDSMQLIIGGIIALIGVLVWINSAAVVDLFPILAGIGLILNGLSNMAPLSDPENNAGTGWIVLFSVLMIAAGIFIIMKRTEVEDLLMVYIGVCYTVNGIFDVILLNRVKDYLMS